MARDWGRLLPAGVRHVVDAASDLVDCTLSEQRIRLAMTGPDRQDDVHRAASRA